MCDFMYFGIVLFGVALFFGATAIWERRRRK